MILQIVSSIRDKHAQFSQRTLNILTYSQSDHWLANEPFNMFARRYGQCLWPAQLRRSEDNGFYCLFSLENVRMPVLLPISLICMPGQSFIKTQSFCFEFSMRFRHCKFCVVSWMLTLFYGRIRNHMFLFWDIHQVFVSIW